VVERQKSLQMQYIHVLAVAKQAVAFVSGRLFDDAESLQVSERTVDGGIGEPGQFFEFDGIRYRMPEHCLMHGKRRSRSSAERGDFFPVALDLAVQRQDDFVTLFRRFDDGVKEEVQPALPVAVFPDAVQQVIVVLAM